MRLIQVSSDLLVALYASVNVLKPNTGNFEMPVEAKPQWGSLTAPFWINCKVWKCTHLPVVQSRGDNGQNMCLSEPCEQKSVGSAETCVTCKYQVEIQFFFVDKIKWQHAFVSTCYFSRKKQITKLMIKCKHMNQFDSVTTVGQTNVWTPF